MPKPAVPGRIQTPYDPIGARLSEEGISRIVAAGFVIRPIGKFFYNFSWLSSVYARRPKRAAPKVITASADPDHLVDTASALRNMIDDAPVVTDSNLQTVLNSPVVVGAAAALQKYMAKAAENGAEAMASGGNGRESMAERAARMSAAADNAATRRAVARS